MPLDRSHRQRLFQTKVLGRSLHRIQHTQVKLPKRLDLARDADRALDSVPGLIVANWVAGR
ncbi:MAG: hypothetical protein CML99_11050 [Rhodobiaceae bacterium]|nr:hypothetical protein [Rhodobiaceae bacterium]